MNEIWIYPELKGSGYSTTLRYKDSLVSVSIGKQGSYGHDAKIITFSLLQADFTVFGSDIEIKSFEDTLSKREYAFRIILQHMTPEWFKYILESVYVKGLIDGRNDIRNQLHELMREE